MPAGVSLRSSDLGNCPGGGEGGFFYRAECKYVAAVETTGVRMQDRQNRLKRLRGVEFAAERDEICLVFGDSDPRHVHFADALNRFQQGSIQGRVHIPTRRRRETPELFFSEKLTD